MNLFLKEFECERSKVIVDDAIKVFNIPFLKYHCNLSFRLEDVPGDP